MARNCPTAKDDRKRTAEDDDAIHMVEIYASEGVFKMDDDEDETGEDVAVQDGASSVLGSAKQSRKYLTFLIENGYGIHDIFALNVRKASSMATARRKSPGRRIDVLLTYVIQGAAPILVGRPLLEKLGLTVDYNTSLNPASTATLSRVGHCSPNG